MTRTVAERIHDALAIAILRGDHAPGTRLPGVRKLAAQHGTTVPTIQRVIEALASEGLVIARQGSGVTVQDPRRARDLSLLPLWFQALRGQPERMARILADFLELRRGVAAQLVRTRRDRLLAALPQLTPLALAVGMADGVDAIARADAALVRGVVDAADSFAVRTVLEAVQGLITEVPLVAQAVYADREAHRQAVASVMAALSRPDPASASAALEAALAEWDGTSVRRFAQLAAEV